MSDNAAFIKLAKELQYTHNNEVVKVAGLLDRIKTLWKKITNPQYRKAISTLQSEVDQTRAQVKGIDEALAGLSTTLANGDIEGYHSRLESVKYLIGQFTDELRETDKKAKQVFSWTVKEMYQPGFLDNVTKTLPEHYDLEFGKSYENMPLTQFAWYKSIDPTVFIHSGSSRSAQSTLIGHTYKAVDAQYTGEEDLSSYFKGENLAAFLEAFEKAIMAGTVLRARPLKPQKGQQATAGQTEIDVLTAPFEVPNLGAQVQATVVLRDLRVSLEEKKRLSLKFTRNVKMVKAPTKLALTQLISKIAGVDRDAVKKLGPEFWRELVKTSRRIGTNPEDLAAVFWAESAFDPGATAVRQGRVVAKGLNQLTEATLPGIGMTKSQWDTMENMSGTEQLPWIEKYYKAAARMGNVDSWQSATQLYVANFSPAYLSKATSPDAVLYKKHKDDGTLNPAYTMNIGLDRKRKGHISVGDLTKSVMHGVPDFIKNKIKEAEAELSGEDPEDEEAPEESGGILASVERLIKKLLANDGVLTRMVKNSILESSLPRSDVLIFVRGSDYSSNLEYARVTASLLAKIINAETEVCSNGQSVEIQCSALGSEEKVYHAVNALAKMISLTMRHKTGRHVYPTVLSGLISKHGAVEFDALISNRRKFNLNRILNG
jgi:hypothetical protein